MGLRHAGVWADPLGPGPIERGAERGTKVEGPAIRVQACLEQGGDYLILQTLVPLVARHARFWARTPRLTPASIVWNVMPKT
jgi:hypothetical protein